MVGARGVGEKVRRAGVAEDLQVCVLGCDGFGCLPVALGHVRVVGHAVDLGRDARGPRVVQVGRVDEAEQEPAVQKQLDAIREEYRNIRPEEIKIIDPCMGSGHILVYAFDVLMAIYESMGYSQRDAAKSILENNLFGLDIDTRANQLAYFALMMKARQYNRRILNGETRPKVYAFAESNGLNRTHLYALDTGFDKEEREVAREQI